LKLISKLEKGEVTKIETLVSDLSSVSKAMGLAISKLITLIKSKKYSDLGVSVIEYSKLMPSFYQLLSKSVSTLDKLSQELTQVGQDIMDHSYKAVEAIHELVLTNSEKHANLVQTELQEVTTFIFKLVTIFKSSQKK